MSFTRQAYHELISWKQQPKRKPLVMQGARQVGKTYLLKHFAAKEFKNHLYINFEKQETVKPYFQNDLEPQKIIKNLQLHFHTVITPETLLIFDEIQECETALTSLKYFQEEMPQQPIVSAGSLLGIKLNQNKGFPVGKVTFLHLFPLTFFEFLNAIGKNNLCEYIRTISIEEVIAPPIHNQLIELLKIYFIVGGMPGVIEKYIESENWENVRNEQYDILNSYHFDFIKHAMASDVMKITHTWDSIPRQLARDNKKFKYATIEKNARAREYENALEWLIHAGFILPAYHLKNKPKLPLVNYSNQNIFKIYSLDTGLLGAQSNLSPSILLEKHKLFTEFKGALTENFAAQEIIAHLGKHLFYWTQDHKAEIDFILQYQNQLIPLEVKSGKNTSAKSLEIYQDLHRPKLSLMASLHNLNKKNKWINIPLYLIGRIQEFIRASGMID